MTRTQRGGRGQRRSAADGLCRRVWTGQAQCRREVDQLLANLEIPAFDDVPQRWSWAPAPPPRTSAEPCNAWAFHPGPSLPYAPSAWGWS